MFEHFHGAEELFRYRLGSALTMEHDSLRMLGQLQSAAQSDEVRQLLAGHAEETRQQQVPALERVMLLMHEDRDRSPSPAMEGLAKEAGDLLRKTDADLIDGVVVAAALATERHETAVYESLIASAAALGRDDVRALLEQTCEQERRAATDLADLAGRVAAAATARAR